MTTYFFLSRKRSNAKGLCPVVCRVCAGRDRTDFRTGVFLPLIGWDAKHAMPGAEWRHEAARLHNVADKVKGFIVECEREGVYSSREVVARFTDSRKPQIITLKDVADEYKGVVKPSALVCDRIDCVVEQFVARTSQSIIRRIVPDTVKGFERSLVASGMSVHTILKKLQFMKRFFAYAAAKKYIPESVFLYYPFPAAPRITLIQLTQAEKATLQEYTFASARLNYARDLFLFQCNTGLSYSDMWVFGSERVIEVSGRKFLSGNRLKTNEEYFLPWLPEAAAIAARYGYSFRRLSNQKYNSYLKEIADILNIDKRLTTHVGRKTFAQTMLDGGYSEECVAKMMGHVNFKMTQRHYARVGVTRVLNEVLKMTG